MAHNPWLDVLAVQLLLGQRGALAVIFAIEHLAQRMMFAEQEWVGFPVAAELVALLQGLVGVLVVKENPRRDDGDGIIALEAPATSDVLDGLAAEGVVGFVAAVFLHRPVA